MTTTGEFCPSLRDEHTDCGAGRYGESAVVGRSMKPIISNDGIQTSGPHPELPTGSADHLRDKDGHGRDLACGRPSRRARKRTLLRTRLMDDVDMIRTMQTL